jgi:hypothetical protein
MPECADAFAAACNTIPNGSLLQAGAIVASALGVIFLILSNRKVACKKAIVDFINHAQTDGDMIEARMKFIALKEAGRLEQFASKDRMASNEANTIRFILNMYEIAAIGIAAKAFDEQIYRDWCRTTLVKDWMATKHFVAQYQREHNPKIYIGFEAMAKKWANEDERRHV